uniref:Integrase catalytic domain-containing protein n=1 Tax=Amphimedon queenslandica TaxID=400682 RepID=A0A1X7UCM1_AMPQE
MASTTAMKVITALKSIFSRYGIPEVLMSDNGPQFACSETKDFATQYQFTHVTSSPLYPQSNGLAERSVKTVKALLQDAEDPYLAYLLIGQPLYPGATSVLLNFRWDVRSEVMYLRLKSNLDLNGLFWINLKEMRRSTRGGKKRSLIKERKLVLFFLWSVVHQYGSTSRIARYLVLLLNLLICPSRIM